MRHLGLLLILLPLLQEPLKLLLPLAQSTQQILHLLLQLLLQLCRLCSHLEGSILCCNTQLDLADVCLDVCEGLVGSSNLLAGSCCLQAPAACRTMGAASTDTCDGGHAPRKRLAAPRVLMQRA